MPLRIATAVGKYTLDTCALIGDFAVFISTSIITLCTTRLKIDHTLQHMERIGVKSCPIIVLTGSCTGLALALQSYIGFHQLGVDEFIGLVVTLGMARELGPVLTGLMVTGRAGSAMAAEIGSMQITEQIDALKTLRINPFQYLIVPRMVGSTLILPFLAIISMTCGIVSGYLFCVYVIGMNPEVYLSTIRERIEMSDFMGGLIKAAFFGFILAAVGTYQGFTTTGGARGVGRATTQSVVVGSMMILVANYLLSSFMFQAGIG